MRGVVAFVLPEWKWIFVFCLLQHPPAAAAPTCPPCCACPHSLSTHSQVVSALDQAMINAECEVAYAHNAEEQGRLARIAEEATWHK